MVSSRGWRPVAALPFVCALAGYTREVGSMKSPEATEGVAQPILTETQREALIAALDKGPAAPGAIGR